MSESPDNPNPSRPGALPFPKALKFEMALQQPQENDDSFTLNSSTPGVVIPGQPPKISLIGIHQPILITIRLVGETVQEMDVRFVDGNPYDAMHFGKGNGVPQGPGTADGMFLPLPVSPDGRELTFLAANTGDGLNYRAKFNYTYEGNSRASASGGPIIIND